MPRSTCPIWPALPPSPFPTSTPPRNTCARRTKTDYYQSASKEDKLAQIGQFYLQDVANYKESWAKEKAIRDAEAKADDLPRVLLKTNKGDIVIELFENQAPNAVANFISLVKKGFYNGLSFHRVLAGFMAQGGDPKGDGTGGPGYTIACECYRPDHRLHFRGTLSMAHAGRDTGGSQFFLTFVPTPHLDGKHTAFGRVVEGMDVLAKLQRRDPGDPEAPRPDKIVEAKVLRKRAARIRAAKDAGMKSSAMRIQTAYTDTSVFGGVFDDEFMMPSREFFDLVQRGRFVLLVSDISRKEMAGTAKKVQSLFDQMLPYMEVVPIDAEVLRLRDAYLAAGILGEKWADDAGHVAAATIGGANLIVSWNFRHIVHFDKIRQYNAVSVLNGYREVDIRSPAEVIDYDDQEKQDL